MRRKDRKLDDYETIDILTKGTYGVLSMCTTNNEGYGISLSYVLDHDQLYFHCAMDGYERVRIIRLSIESMTGKLESNKKRIPFNSIGKTE